MAWRLRRRGLLPGWEPQQGDVEWCAFRRRPAWWFDRQTRFGTADFLSFEISLDRSAHGLKADVNGDKTMVASINTTPLVDLMLGWLSSFLTVPWSRRRASGRRNDSVRKTKPEHRDLGQQGW